MAKASFFFSYHSANRTLENFPTGETDSQPVNLKVEIDLRGQWEMDWSGRRGREVEKKRKKTHTIKGGSGLKWRMYMAPRRDANLWLLSCLATCAAQTGGEDCLCVWPKGNLRWLHVHVVFYFPRNCLFHLIFSGRKIEFPFC